MLGRNIQFLVATPNSLLLEDTKEKTDSVQWCTRYNGTVISNFVSFQDAIIYSQSFLPLYRKSDFLRIY